LKKGLFIVFEGPDGAGKTTILEKVHNELKSRGIKCISTREPGGIVISEKIRNIILDKENTAMDGRTEALLYAAARRQHLVEKVIPALEEGTMVLCDRFVLSSLAYQGFARGIGIDEVMSINEFAIDVYMPDMTIYFDINPEAAMKRIMANSEREINRLDLESINFHNKVQEGYKKIIGSYGYNIKEVNGEKSVDEVYKAAISIIDDILK